MNRILLALILTLALPLGHAWGYVKPRILITTSVAQAMDGYKEIEMISDYLADTIQGGILKAFPCASPATEKDIKLMLDWERRKSLLGYYTDKDTFHAGHQIGQEALDKESATIRENLDGYKDYRYFIMLKITGKGQSTEMTVLCMDRLTNKTAITLHRTAGTGDAAAGPIGEMADELVKKMAYLEICPYTGPVTVTVSSVKKNDDTTHYPVFCNNSDGVFHQNSREETSTTQDWRLKRIGKPDTTGEMTATIHEFRENREENGCYSCASGRKGGRSSTKTTTLDAEVNGLSNRSRMMGEPENHDATIQLIFNENGTYMVSIDGTSLASNYRGKVREKAEGTCDLVNTNVDLTEEQINTLIRYNRALPLNGKWGPFPGTPFDKQLSGKKEILLNDTATKEESKIGIDFDLQRN
ncbi:hypothetical protein [uncultured Desulfobulbus sp.]|uniref:hypothetical protein n=1 Tax=uncultured Desulfobulbus sp. TaxID=239745 RepID=UPI0029C7236A|nr:hypothetical protein [uncultured Desulfobulbus sp.]